MEDFGVDLGVVRGRGVQVVVRVGVKTGDGEEMRVVTQCV